VGFEITRRAVPVITVDKLIERIKTGLDILYALCASRSAVRSKKTR
jgi:hypothetical protein